MKKTRPIDGLEPIEFMDDEWHSMAGKVLDAPSPDYAKARADLAAMSPEERDSFLDSLPIRYATARPMLNQAIRTLAQRQLKKKIKGGEGSGYDEPHLGLPGHWGGSRPRSSDSSQPYLPKMRPKRPKGARRARFTGYHGTDAQFEKFEVGIPTTRSYFMGIPTPATSRAVFFTKNRRYARGFAQAASISHGRTAPRVYKTDVQLENMLDLSRPGAEELKLLEEAGFDLESNMLNTRRDYEDRYQWSNFPMSFRQDSLWQAMDEGKVIENLKKMGYDGVKIIENYEEYNPETGEAELLGSGYSWGVFDPSRSTNIVEVLTGQRMKMNLMSNLLVRRLKGGPGSGYDSPHRGLPGHWGGSRPRGSSGEQSPDSKLRSGLVESVTLHRAKPKKYSSRSKLSYKNWIKRHPQGEFADKETSKALTGIRKAMSELNTGVDYDRSLYEYDKLLGKDENTEAQLEEMAKLRDDMDKHGEIYAKAVGHLLHRDTVIPTAKMKASDDPLSKGYSFDEDHSRIIQNAIDSVFGSYKDNGDTALVYQPNPIASFYDPEKNAINLEFLKSGKTFARYLNPTMTAIHETGHWIEGNGGVAKNATEYYEKRTGVNTKDPKFKEALWGIIQFPDKFYDEYMGKYYLSGSTELVSSGIAYLFTDPVNFISSDRGTAGFIYDTLMGRNGG